MAKRKLGNCYKVHANALVDGSEVGVLCHGTVWHPDVGWHSHCWIEDEEEVRDISNGHDITMPIAFYYDLGRVKDVKRYTVDEAMKMMQKQKFFGPWEE